MICKKNIGCSHIIFDKKNILGSGTYDSEKYFEISEDIDIKPIYFDKIGYLEKENRWVNYKNDKNIILFSRNNIRKLIQNGEKLPSWYIRPQVQELIDEGTVFYQ